ncbi:Olfactory receptor 50 [Sciurus carolinensis]|uniref:Olfactory receptor 50 n=1 Tax=Sciurus carolinensis TaxID=30640 RepID=A0AA41T2R1_SCICA|nr:Olfactory receptor 50 [Sciurus carolinensis]
MRRENQSSVSEFLLLGLPIQPEEQGMYYALFLAMYLTTVLGNLLIILLIRLDSCLHTPMYFFLSHLALTDICFSSVTAPKMLMNMLTQTQSISYAGCICQEFFFVLFEDLDSFLLTSMAYDRHRSSSPSANSSLNIYTTLCPTSSVISLPNLSSDTTVNQLVILTVGSVVITLPFMCILVSYGHIGATILRRPSIQGICKVLSTCGSHLSVVFLYYGAIIALYFVPSSISTNDKDVIVSVLYALVTPMLNPFIYTLRNRDIKEALRNILSRGIISLRFYSTFGEIFFFLNALFFHSFMILFFV